MALRGQLARRWWRYCKNRDREAAARRDHGFRAGRLIGVRRLAVAASLAVLLALSACEEVTNNKPPEQPPPEQPPPAKLAPDLSVRTNVSPHFPFEFRDGEGYSTGTGGLVYFHVYVDNLGAVDSPATTLRLYQSTDATITSSDEVWTGAVPTLGPIHRGDFHVHSSIIPFIGPPVPRRYYFAACVDVVPDELNTGDNCDSTPIDSQQSNPRQAHIDFISGGRKGKYNNFMPVITDADPSVYSSLTYTGVETVQHIRPGGLRFIEAYVFSATYADSTAVNMVVHRAPWCPVGGVVTRHSAEVLAVRYATELGRLPAILRRRVEEFIITRADEGDPGGGAAPVTAAGGRTVVIADNCELPSPAPPPGPEPPPPPPPPEHQPTHGLILHEVGHVMHYYWSENGMFDEEWSAAAAAEGGPVTFYAETNMAEDVAESVLTWVYVRCYAGRLDPVEVEWIEAEIPGRFALFDRLIGPSGCSLT